MSLRIPLPTLLPWSDFRCLWMVNARRSTRRQNLRVSSYKGSHYFDNYFTQSNKVWFARRRRVRDVIVCFNRLRANHYNLASSLARKGFVLSSSCNCGAKFQDIDHILWVCPLYADNREVFVDQLRSAIKEFFPCTTCLLKSLDSKVQKCISSFLENCELKI